ncbi:transposon Tf2-12 polyprotein [Tanacetum coccineum]|uniref:Transposon Tf2-12 polyprotein n=1 Tax=Tanacetum coccineum TaxID=301880 RepID=A0ABQ5IU66_9ASTR
MPFLSTGMTNEVEFLGHKIIDGGLMMNDAKIKAIQDWEPPTKDKECQEVFESLKKAAMEEPVLRLPDVTMPFELHTDASDFAIGGVLMQDGHPVAFESRKLNETERKYTPRKANVVADALSRTAKFVAITQAQFFLQDRIKEGLEHDPLAKKIIALAKDGRTRRFWLKEEMLFTKGDRLYMPKWGNLRRAILKGCHDLKWVGHSGITRTLALVEGTYYWPRMGAMLRHSCGRALFANKTRLLKPLPMPKGPWESVSMDFITCFPNSEGGGSIIVVVDRFSKYGTFIAAPSDVTADDTAKLFFKNVDKLLDVAQFSYNMKRSEATGKSPFELVTGRQPFTPNVLAASYEGSSPTAYKTINEWHEQVDLAWALLDKAAKKMKKWADEKRWHVEFEVGDQVMMKLLSQQFKSLRKVHKGLIWRYEGPFPVIGRVGKVSYRVQPTAQVEDPPGLSR